MGLKAVSRTRWSIDALLHEAGRLNVFIASHFSCRLPLFGHEHSHPHHYHFSLIRRGGCDVVVQGRRYSVGPGDMVVAYPGWTHASLSDDDTDYELMEVKFSSPGEEELAAAMPVLPAVIRFHEAASILSCLQRIVESKRLEASVSPSLLPLYLIEMIALCARETERLAEVHEEGSEERLWVRQAMEHIRLSYAERLSVGSLAELVHKSPSHFAACFRRVTGTTPIQFLIDTRMVRAKELLIHTRLSVRQIAEVCGFSSPQYFARLFARRERMTPSSFRESGWANAAD